MIHRPVHHDTDEFGNPSRGENYQQDFQAPFYPSVNLDKAPDSKNSWAVVTPANKLDTNKIDRSDSHNIMEPNDKAAKAEQSTSSSDENVDEMITEKFSMDKFQPEFQGGFKPIYPSVQLKSNVNIQGKHANKDESIEALVYESKTDATNDDDENADDDDNDNNEENDDKEESATSN